MPHFSGALRVLGLSGCGIGDTEIDAIARMLPSLKELKEITLHGNEITDVGAKSMGLGLRFSPWIEQIGMNGNLLTATGLFHLFYGISIPNSQMKRLYLGWNAIDSNGDALRFLEKAIDQILSGRTFRQPMEILSLPYNDLCDAGAKQFAKLVACGAVHTLDLESNHLTDVGVQCLLHSLQQCRPSVAFLGLCEQLLLPATLQSAHEVFKEKKLRPEHFLDPIVLHRCRNPSMRRRLFHITTQENAFKIQESKELHCGKDGMFGPGIYFARTPSEAFGKTIHGLLTSNLGEKPSSEVYVIECMVSLPWKMKVLHSPLSSKEMEDIPVAERCFLSACTDTIEWIVADSQRAEVLDVYPIAAQNDVSRLLHTSPFDYSDKGWHAAAVHVVFLCTEDDEKDVSVLRIFQELEELVKAAGRKIASFVCSAAQTNSLVEDFIRRVELSEGDLVIARCELFSQIDWIHDNLQYFQEVFGGVTTIVLKRKPFSSSSSSSPVLDNSDEIILDSLQVSQCNQQTLQKFIEQNILARVLPGVKLLVLESSSFYDKFMKPLQEKAKLLSLLEGAIEVSDRNVLRFTKEGEPLWHVIFTTRGDAWILLPNSAHHPPGIQWRFTATSSDSCHEESVLQQRCSFIAWWIHPHFVTLEWKQKLEFLMNHPPMYSEEIPFSSSWLLDMFEVSNVSKPSTNYLHTIRDFSLPEHLQSLKEMHSETLQWLTSKLGVEKSQISSFVHYPNGLPVTTLHIHYRLNISDELTLPEDQPGKTIFLSNATPSDSTYGFQSLRSLPLETILQWLQESPTALQQYPFRYSVWTCRPCWQSTLASKESSFVIYNGKLALLGDASSDISQKFEQLLTRQGCETTFANDHHQVIATDPSNESFFQKLQVIDCLPKSGFVSEKIVFVSVVGDSGAGKDTGLSFCRNNSDISEMFFMPKRVISRVSRGNDTETAISVTTEQFRQMSINGAFAIEYWHPTFPGLGYALLKTDVDFAINQRKSIVMNIGRFALQYLRTWCNQRGIIFTVILVKAPVNELEQRIRSRGRDVEADIYHRVEGAKKGTFRIYRAQSEHVFEIYNDSTREIYEERMKLALQCCAVVGKK